MNDTGGSGLQRLLAVLLSSHPDNFSHWIRSAAPGTVRRTDSRAVFLCSALWAAAFKTQCHDSFARRETVPPWLGVHQAPIDLHETQRSLFSVNVGHAELERHRNPVYYSTPRTFVGAMSQLLHPECSKHQRRNRAAG